VSQAEDRQADLGPAREPDARGDLLFIAIAAAVLLVIISFNALNLLDEWKRAGRTLELWEPMVWEGSSGLVLLSISPLVLALVRRVWPIDPPYLPKLGIHLLAACGVSLIHVVAIGAIRWTVYAALNRRYDAFGPLGDWPYELRKDLLVYAAIVAIYVAWRRLRARPQAAAASPDVLEVRDGARRHFVPLADVVWVEAAGNYVELHRGGAGLLHRASLAEMERRLRTAGFVRIHRSRLVRREAVAAVESKPTGDFLVRLRDGRELAGSRRFRRPLLAD
jgi:hypothetical protein